MERTVYLRKRPLPFLKRIPGIRSLRLAQHWAIQVGENGDIWELERLSKKEISFKKGNLAEWEDAAQKWPKEPIGTTNSTDTEIASVVRNTLERMKGSRPQNDPVSMEDWEYAIGSKMVHKVFHLGDYSIGQNNCQDLVVAVAKALSGRTVDLGTILKPRAARMFARRHILQGKAAGHHHHRVVHHQQHLHGISMRHHHTVHR
ncbi:hypothetical protein MMC22_002760 [Lobaria immixta]|nr:hypothetical protein [Lobaria immixta]